MCWNNVRGEGGGQPNLNPQLRTLSLYLPKSSFTLPWQCMRSSCQNTWIIIYVNYSLVWSNKYSTLQTSQINSISLYFSSNYSSNFLSFTRCWQSCLVGQIWSISYNLRRFVQCRGRLVWPVCQRSHWLVVVMGMKLAEVPVDGVILPSEQVLLFLELRKKRRAPH